MRKISNLLLGANIKIPERQEDGTYKLTDYMLGCYNNFGINTVGFVRKDIHSVCRFGDNTEYVGSDLDKRMAEIFDSYPDELQDMIVDVEIPLHVGGNPIEITRSVFAPTLTMVGCGDNNGVDEGLTWPIFTGRHSRKKAINGVECGWWLSSQVYSWLSSPVLEFDWLIGVEGYTDYSVPSYSFGVVPAFVVPQSIQIDYTTDNGSYKLKGLSHYYTY